MTKDNANSLELLRQSEEIRKQSDALKKKEAPEVLARIKEAVAHYGFTAADLGLSGGQGQHQGRKLRQAQQIASGQGRPCAAQGENTGLHQVP